MMLYFFIALGTTQITINNARKWLKICNKAKLENGDMEMYECWVKAMKKVRQKIGNARFLSDSLSSIVLTDTVVPVL
jgi:hypothetical protein